MSKNIIGVDLGGTNIRAGKVVEQKIISLRKKNTPSQGTEQEVLDALTLVIDECFDNETIAIGIGVPSVVDVEKGIVYNVQNIPSWKAVPLKTILEKKYNVPVFVNNDANCFVLGEKYYGKGKPYSSIVGLCIGTGLGSGLIFNNKLYEGRNCGAGELGNIPYLEHNFEQYCSGHFFSDLLGTDAKSACEEGLNGDGIAREQYAKYGYHLAQCIKIAMYAYDPELIILGGSLANAFELFKPSLMAAIQNLDYPNTLKNLRIEVSEMENPAIYGAAALFKNSQLQ
jgi:glucokinase